MAISYETPAFTIPVVDISPYLSNPQSVEAEQVVDQIRAACVTSGFFQITGHGISEALQDQIFSAAKTLFALPEDDKRKLVGKPGRGYETIGSQILEAGKKPDLKEVSSPIVRGQNLRRAKIVQGFMIGREIPDHEPPFRPFQDPNIWPDSTQIPEPQFKQPLLEYHQALSDLSVQLMHILARGLKGFDTGVFDEYCKDPIANVRLLHYPPHPQTDDKELVGAGAHTDFGAITLLLQDGHSGLQVLNQHTRQFVDVPPQEHAYVVNIGDMLETWTSGQYKSNIHRVARFPDPKVAKHIADNI